MNQISGRELYEDYFGKLKEPKFQNERRLADKLQGYVYDSHCFFVTYITYRVWQAVKSIFGKSDWQQAQIFIRVCIRKFQVNHLGVDKSSPEFKKYCLTFAGQILKYEFTKLKLVYQLKNKSVVDEEELQERTKIPTYDTIESHFSMNCPKLKKS